LALFPEMIDQKYALSTESMKIFPEGHINKSGSAYSELPIDFRLQVGGSAIEVVSTPEGIVGDATLADAKKAVPGVKAILDYVEKLINDIMTMYPAGKLPPIKAMTMKDKKEIEDVINNPAASSGVCWICKELDCWRDLIPRSSLQVLTLS